MVEGGMKLLVFLVVASLALPAVIDALLDYEFEPADAFFGVVDGGGSRFRLAPFYRSANARILATKAQTPPKPKMVKVVKAQKAKSPPPPPPKPKSPPPPKPKSPPPPKPKSPPPSPKPKSPPPPKPKSPPPSPKPKSPPPPSPKPKSPPPPSPKPKSPPPPSPKPKSPPPPPSPIPKSPPPPPPSPLPKSPPPSPSLLSPPPPSPLLLSPPPPSPPLLSPPPPSPPLLSPPPPSPPLLSPPPPSPSPPPPSPPPPTPCPDPPGPGSAADRNTARWEKYYMNNWTPVDPPGGLVLTDDQLHIDMKMTSRAQIFGNFISRQRYLFGYFSLYLKLIPNDSAGINMAYYFTSPEHNGDPSQADTHDEIDFEFLGNTSGNPISLQTNLYLAGKGGREQRHYLPFDPTADFHKYSLLWNQNLIIWYVDNSVIRVHYNKPSVPYPSWRPMAAEVSLWNASDWATQGGAVKLDINKAPFVLQVEGFDGIDGCAMCNTNSFTDPSLDCPMSPSNTTLTQCSSGHWWNQQAVLTSCQISQLQAHSQNYIYYNYCYKYYESPAKVPPECRYNEYPIAI